MYNLIRNGAVMCIRLDGLFALSVQLCARSRPLYSDVLTLEGTVKTKLIACGAPHTSCTEQRID